MPANRAATRRDNQRHRTRKDLLEAAARLLQRGGVPGMDEVAAEAMVSRATAYRYFPSVEALLVEAPLDGLIPGPERVFPADDESTDPAERIDRAEAALHDACYRYEAQLRRMLAASLARTAKGSRRDGVPVRQNRRTLLIEAALAPARRRLSKSAYARLCAALAIVLGAESMIVFRDVLGLDERTARKVKSWAVRSLVAAALKDSDKRR
ncbi:MAG: TetR/AcrR family transcriptional regulator [Phycisphaeraceae bacterium]|nr:TetR/AcrR family transcriptional regulator [Phycisphaeraceae bacterium]